MKQLENTNSNCFFFILNVIIKLGDSVLKDGDIVLRKLKNDTDDYKLLEKWYQEECVYLHFEQRKLNYDEIVRKYRPRTIDGSNVLVYMIEYKNIPVGIIQYQKVNDKNRELYKIDSNNSYEIDIFIGDISYHNIGIGSRCINILSNYLFNNKNADILVMSPLRSNNRAINCYKKCGFVIKDYYNDFNTIRVLQEYVLMILEK